MIPYIEIKGDNSIDVNIDLIILYQQKPIIISACDLAIKTKKLAADLISDNYSTLLLKDRMDLEFEQTISNYIGSFRYKSTKQGDLTHTIIYNKNINNYIIDWNNEGEIAVVTKYLQNRLYMPITEDIVAQVLNNTKYKNDMLQPLDVYTSNPMFENIKAYCLNGVWFKQDLERLDLFADSNDSFDWDKIETIEDYLLAFADPINKKLRENINILYDPQHINKKMFEGKYKPFRGQVPIIQSALEVLKRDRFVYINAEMGSGKSTISSKVNHCHMYEKNKHNYITLILAPAITLSQWKKELKQSIADDIDVKIYRKTIDFIRWYNKTNMQVEKPTYILIGKETFKLDYKKRPAYVKKTAKVKYKTEKIRTGTWRTYTTIDDVEEIKEVLCCPECGIPLKNPLRKTQDVFFTAKDFTGNPKKSNYKCQNCGSVLWQATFDKTKKTSLINFIKVKNIKFDSVIVDEAHESNKSTSIIGNATRTLFNYTNKIILLTGTSNNGYASSMHNILMGLLSRKLKKDEAINIKDFVEKYGTLQAVTKKRDGEYFSYGKAEIRDSDWKEIEGINSLVFTKYLANNYVFATLQDLEKEYPELDYLYCDKNIKVLPELTEKYIPIQHIDAINYNENNLLNQFKEANALNHAQYADSIVKHYINNPFDWKPIVVNENTERSETVTPINMQDSNLLLPKEEKLLEIVQKEIAEGRKVWVYTEFTGGGQYMQGENIPNRLERILKTWGYKVYQLKPSVATYDRKDIIDKYKDKYDIFISNPRLVQTGVNLQFCPTYIVYIPSYQVNIIAQATRRGYRVNSIADNRIYHLYYVDTIEDAVIKRYQRKLAESKAIEGKFNVTIEKEDEIRTASKLAKKISSQL